MKDTKYSDNDTGTVFSKHVDQLSGVDLNRCYQCLTCTLSCPFLNTMDYLPNQIIRMVQLGARSEVLQSSTIWACVSCETCATRCPNEIDIPRLMDTLRQMALRAGLKGKETSVSTFNRIFLKGIERRGKQYELGMVLELKLRSRDFFSDVGLGIKMLGKGKLKLLPTRVRSNKEIRAIFRKSKEKRD